LQKRAMPTPPLNRLLHRCSEVLAHLPPRQPADARPQRGQQPALAERDREPLPVDVSHQLFGPSIHFRPTKGGARAKQNELSLGPHAGSPAQCPHASQGAETIQNRVILRTRGWHGESCTQIFRRSRRTAPCARYRMITRTGQKRHTRRPDGQRLQRSAGS